MKPPNYAGLEGYEGLGGVATTCPHGAYPGRIKAAVCDGARTGADKPAPPLLLQQPLFALRHIDFLKRHGKVNRCRG